MSREAYEFLKFQSFFPNVPSEKSKDENACSIQNNTFKRTFFPIIQGGIDKLRGLSWALEEYGYQVPEFRRESESKKQVCKILNPVHAQWAY